MEPRKIATLVALKMYGLPYEWGGDDTIDGFDCSGMVVEILKSAGVLPHTGDWTANDLWLRFRDKRVDSPAAGRLVFYGTASKITHIEYCLSDKFNIGASGGGSRTTSPEEAARVNAFVKIRPTDYRDDIVGFVDPFLDNWSPDTTLT